VAKSPAIERLVSAGGGGCLGVVAPGARTGVAEDGVGWGREGSLLGVLVGMGKKSKGGDNKGVRGAGLK